MTPSSSPSTSKPTLLTSIRRLTPKLKREPVSGESYVPSIHAGEASTRDTTSTSFSRSKYPAALSRVYMVHESQGSSTPTDESSSASSVYCPPLARPPSPPPRRRVRMSGSRLPSGHRPASTHTPIPTSPSPTHTSASLPVCPQPGPASTPASEIPQHTQPLRTRLTRFLHRHTAPSSFTMSAATTTLTHSTATPMSTPTSSILSFPSSSSRTTTPPSTSASSPAGSRRHVRFSTQRVREEEKRTRSLDLSVERGVEKEKAHLSDAFARMGSPWRRTTNPTHEGHAS